MLNKNIKKRVVLILFTFIFLITMFIVNADNTILLKSRYLVPVEGVSDATKVKITSIPERAHVLIQLDHIPTNKERREIEAKGIKLLSYIPNKAWFASIPSNESEKIVNFSNVRSITEVLPEDKIAPKVRERGVGTWASNEDETVAYIDPDGNLCIEEGDCSDNSPNCDSPVGDPFVIKNDQGNNVIYIDDQGSLCLTGVLSENSTHNLLTIGER